MKVLHVVLVLCGLVLGFSIAGISPADAQQDAQPARASGTQRYQISAFAGRSPDGSVFNGCYTVDTSTGEMWLTVPGAPEQKVAQPRAK